MFRYFILTASLVCSLNAGAQNVDVGRQGLVRLPDYRDMIPAGLAVPVWMELGVAVPKDADRYFSGPEEARGGKWGGSGTIGFEPFTQFTKEKDSVAVKIFKALGFHAGFTGFDGMGRS